MEETAQKERDQLLKERPKLKKFQNEIDRILDNSGNSENRMSVLGILIEGRLKELQSQLSRLSFLIRQMETCHPPSCSTK